MTTLSLLKKIKTREKKRIGRGYGSGKGGHTVGRGQKGQKTRDRIGPLFEGTKGKKSWLKRLPRWRGKGRFKPQKSVLAIDLSLVEKYFASGETVDEKSLTRKGLLPANQSLAVKLLGRGKLEKKLVIAIPCSASAQKAVIQAGGKLIGKKQKEK